MTREVIKHSNSTGKIKIEPGRYANFHSFIYTGSKKKRKIRGKKKK